MGRPRPRWRSARPSPHKQHGIIAPFFDQGSRTPVDCQAISLFPTRKPPRSVRRRRLCRQGHQLVIKSLSSSQHGPRDPHELVGERHHCNILMSAGQQSLCPTAQRCIALGQVWQCSPRAMDEQPSKVLVASLADPGRRGLPPVVDWRGTRPSHAARSRPRAKELALPTAAIRAVAIVTPTPGMDVNRRASSFSLAQDTNSASKSAMRRSSSCHCAIMSAINVRIRRLRPQSSCSPIKVARYRSSFFLPCGTTDPRSSRMARNWLIREVRSPTNQSRARCSVCMSSCASFFSSTNRMVGLVAASAIPSAS